MNNQNDTNAFTEVTWIWFLIWRIGLFSTLIWCFTSDANKTATSQFVLWCTKKYSNEFRHTTLFQATSATLYAKQSLHFSFCLISELLCVTIIDFFLSSHIRCDHYLWTLFSCTACYITYAFLWLQLNKRTNKIKEQKKTTCQKK